MDDETKERLREEQRERARRQNHCPRCGSGSIRTVPGEQLDQADHFAGILYRLCGACGYEAVKRARKRRS